MTELKQANLNQRQIVVLLSTILVVASCGIIYELIIGTVSSYLLGNSVFQFSITIGFFMFSMGVGSWLSKFLTGDYIRNFVAIEIAIALVGGISSTLLFMAFPFARPLYELTMYSLIFVIGVLVGMEIPILTTLMAKGDQIKDSIANVLSLDYIGALFGSVAFPLLLLPSLGLVQSSFAIGLINILVATINVVVFKEHLRHYQQMLAVCFAIIVALVAFIFFGNHITRFAEQQLYFDQVIYTEQTPYQKLVVTRSPINKEQRLYIDGHIQFSSRDEYRYHEFLVHPAMSLINDGANVLILGGGDGLAAREVLKYPSVKHIDLVDIDPAMLRLGKDLPILKRINESSMSNPRLSLHAQDAFTFINQPGTLYDAVIIDMPDPHNEAINKLYAREFYTMIKRRMRPGAAVVTQSSSPFFTPRVFWSIEATLASVFDHTLSYKTALPSFGIWGFNMARSGTGFPNDFRFDVPTRSLTQSTMNAAKAFGKDLAKREVPINSIMEPKLYLLYEQDLKL